MPLIITPLYACSLTILLILLSVRTIRARRRARVAVGTGVDPSLTRAARAHGNFTEYAPFVLILMALAELNSASPLILHLCGVAFTLGRALHAYGISREQEDLRFRVSGMILTFLTLGTLVALNLWRISIR